MGRRRGRLRHPVFLLAILGCLGVGGLAGYLTRFAGPFAPLGGPNALLYDAALAVAYATGQGRGEPGVVFVEIDGASLSRPPLRTLPRPLFQPVWAELIDKLLAAGARKVAFDIVFAYAGNDFAVGDFRLPGYDSRLLEVLGRSRGQVVLGRYPAFAPIRSFERAAGAANVAVLDLQPESDGRVRSAAPLLLTGEGRLAFGFAALGAGLTPQQIGGRERLLVVPDGPLIRRPTYRIGDLLACLQADEGRAAVARHVAGKVVVIGSSVPGEDEHRGPTRWIGEKAPRPAEPPSVAARRAPDPPQGPADCAARPYADPAVAGGNIVPGALIQAAAIEEAMRPERVRIADPNLVTAAGALFGALFGGLAMLTRAPRERGGTGSWSLLSIVGLTALAVSGPVIAGTVISVAAFVVFRTWIPLGGPILVVLTLAAAIVTARSFRHRQEFDRLFEVAGRYLPLDFISDPERAAAAQTGEEREVSLLLADFVGFTDFITDPSRSASEVVQEVNRYFSVMQDAVDRYGGYTDKFIGDAILAFWNGISPDPDHAWKAVAAARAIIDDLARMEHEGAGLRARVVVATGRVYLGDLGADQRRNLTIVGSVVNEAFRLEKMPDLYGLPIVLAGGAAEACGHGEHEPGADPTRGFVFVRLDDVSLKGFAELRPIYGLVDPADPGLRPYREACRALEAGRLAAARAAFAAIREGALAGAASRRLRLLEEASPRPGPRGEAQALPPAPAPV